MSEKIISMARYKMEHGTCSKKTIDRMMEAMRIARPRRINVGEDILVHEYRSENEVYEWELEGSLDNIAAYICSNNYGKVFYDIETEQPLFMCIGQVITMTVSTEYTDQLKRAIKEYGGFFYRNKHEFLCR